MGSGTELIFVEGHSTDDTWATIQQAIARYSGPAEAVARSSRRGKGKGDAVRLGFAQGDRRHADDPRRRSDGAARGAAGLLRRHRRAGRPTSCRGRGWSTRWSRGRCASSTSWATWRSRSCSPTCCSSRSRTRCAAPRCCGGATTSGSPPTRAYFGDFDPFGDFDLIFGAARLNLKIVEIPVRYRDRTYGETNIQRWKHGWLLLKMSAIAARKINSCDARGRRRARRSRDSPSELRSAHAGALREAPAGVGGRIARCARLTRTGTRGSRPSCRRRRWGRGRARIGAGVRARVHPRLELTDLVRAPWHDREASAEALPFDDGSVGALVLFDVLHHLPSPRRSSTRRCACWRRAAGS